MSDGGISKEPMLEIYLFETTQLIEQLEEISIECEKNKVIDTETLFDLVLLVIDFIKSEIEKIENGENADASSDELIVRTSNNLE